MSTLRRNVQLAVPTTRVADRVAGQRGRMSVVRDWRDRAACLYEDPDLFFPVGTTSPAAGQTELALQVCTPCPVRNECLAFALTADMDHGIWGGHTEDDRRSLRSRHRSRRSQPIPPSAVPPGRTAPGRTASAQIRIRPS